MWLRLGVLVLLVLTSAVAGEDPVDHEGVVKELLDAVRSGNTESMQGFLERRFGGSEGMDTLEFMSMELGSELRFHGVIERSDDRILGLVQNSTGEKWIGVVLEFRDGEGGLSAIGLRKAEPPSDNVMTAATRSELVGETFSRGAGDLKNRWTSTAKYKKSLDHYTYHLTSRVSRRRKVRCRQSPRLAAAA